MDGIYYRKITDFFPQKNLSIQKIKNTLLNQQIKLNILRFFSILLFSVILFLAFLSFKTYLVYEKARKEYKSVQEELFYWEEIIKKHPNYTDAYYNAALQAYSLKDKEKAKNYLREALFRDPNFERAQNFQKLF